jgi:DNA repair protein RecN (Recombination protein N)
LTAIDPAMAEVYRLFDQAVVELREVSHELDRGGGRFEYNPERLAKINERLESIHRLKKKYGPNIEDIHKYRQQLEVKLEELEAADWQIEEIEKEIEKQEDECGRLAAELTKQRVEAAAVMEKSLQKHLRSLNMQKVDFQIQVASRNRTAHGDDRVEFFFRPNIGEKLISVTESASGGELSRIMLSLQVLLAGKENVPAIIFDEIDANIGGETAKSVGDKLQEIGKAHQVLCITHFPQVAENAAHHLQISKDEIEGRTLTVVQTLDSRTKALELERMRGGCSMVSI